VSRIYCIYILASRSRNLYIGVTNDLDRRMLEHRQGLIPGFTSQYRIFHLVHFQGFGNINEAIAREKEIKAWRREKKIRLIEHDNAAWHDLAEHLPNQYKREADAANQHPPRKADPSHHHGNAVPGSG
jgi:putative endonuclease